MKKHYPAFEQLCELARKNVTEITVASVKELMDKHQSPLLVDVREENEWQKDHIPTAIHISRGVLERDIEGVITDKARPIIAYCGGGYRSALAVESIQKMGYSHVRSMAGGYRAWSEAGYPLVNK